MRFGRWEVTGDIGRGGAARVFRGRGPRGEDVAIKHVIASGERLERFEREVRLQSELGDGEGFVPLLDAGRVSRHDGAPEGIWLVMPYLPGGTLRDRIRRGPYEVDDAVALVTTLAGALAVAHKQGIVHRDLKPENVLFAHRGAESGDDGRPLIADLGLAKRLDPSEGPKLSLTGEFLGTAGYGSPEQMQDAAHVGPPADVFALGAILYECVAGVPAFPGASPLEVVGAVTDGRFTPLRRARDAVPAWLDALVTRALDPDPERRFADAGELELALRAKGQAPRGTARWVVAALLLVACGGGAYGVGTGAFTGPRAGSPPVAPPGLPVKGATPASRGGRAPLSADLAAIATGDRMTIESLLGSVAFRMPSPAVALAASTDGTRAAAIDGWGFLRVFQVPSGEPVFTVDARVGPGVAVGFSPDGSRVLAAGRDKMTRIYDAATGVETLHVTHDGVVTAATWSKNPRVFATGLADGRVFQFDAAAEKQLKVWTQPNVKGPVHALAYGGPNDAFLLAGYESNEAWLLTAVPAEDLHVTGDAPVLSVAASPSGRTFAVGFANGLALVAERATKATRNNVNGDGAVRSLAYDGEDRLVCAFDGNGVNLVDLARKERLLTLGFESGPGPSSAVFLPGGTHLLAVNRRDAVVMTANLEDRTLAVGGPDGPVGEATSIERLDDGRLVTFGPDRIVRFWKDDRPAGGKRLDVKVARALVAASGRVVVACDQACAVLDLASSRGVAATREHGALVNDVDVDGERVVTGAADGVVRTLDGSLAPLGESAPLGAPVTAVRFVGGAIVAFAGEDAHLLDGTLARVATLAVGAVGRSACAVGSENRVAVGRADGCVRVVRVGAGSLEQACEIVAHENAVTACAWSVAGDRLATAGRDGAVRVWDTGFVPRRSLRGELSLARVGDAGTSLRFDGEDLLVGTARGPILRVACARSPRGE